MSKAILISIKPKWVAKILNGEKTIEIRKTCPAIFKHLHSYEGASLDVYIYCTKDKDILYENVLTNNFYLNLHNPAVGVEKRNGKVVAKFTLNRVEEIKYQRVFEQNPFHYLEEESGYGTVTLNAIDFKKETCLTDKELEDYLNTDKPNKRAYAIHITKLEIFDKPKELSEFKCCAEKTCVYGKCHKYMHCLKPLTKAPQSWCYVEVEECIKF